MDKSLGALLRFWGVFQFTQVQPLPSPHKQCWTRVSRVFFPSFNFVQCGGRENCKKILKRMHCFKREPRYDRKNMNIAVLSQGRLSRIIGFFVTSHSRNPTGEGSVGESRVGWLNFKMSPFGAQLMLCSAWEIERKKCAFVGFWIQLCHKKGLLFHN